MSKEREQQERPRPISEPLHPSPLPPELVEFLTDRPLAAVWQGTDRGTVLVVKAPGREIQSARGLVPIYIRHELYQHPAAPVIRTVVRIFDQPEHPLAFETFTNIQDPQQKEDFARLATQETLLLLFYDERLSHRLTKGVSYPDHGIIPVLLSTAERLRAEIADEAFNFDQAKAEVMWAVNL